MGDLNIMNWFTLLASLLLSSIARPQSDMVGTSRQGGADMLGVLFRINDQGLEKAYELKYTYRTTGSYTGRLTIGPQGMLFGTAQCRPHDGNGLIFSYDPITNVFNEQRSFDAPDVWGTDPRCPLLLESGGTFLGACAGGGAHGFGTIYRYDPATSAIVKLHDLDSVNGDGPIGRLMLHSNGMLYGCTVRGGQFDRGVLYQFNPNTNDYTVLHSFQGPEGYEPCGGVVEEQDGSLVGMCNYGGFYLGGSIYRYNLSNSSLTVVFDLGNDGYRPLGEVVISPTGLFYGSVGKGVWPSFGGLFRFDPTLSTFTMVHSCFAEGPPAGTPTMLSDGRVAFLTHGYNWQTPAGGFRIYDPVADVMDVTTTTQANSDLLEYTNGRLYAHGPWSIISLSVQDGSVSGGPYFGDKSLGDQFNSHLVNLSSGHLLGSVAQGCAHNRGGLFTFDPVAIRYDTLFSFTDSTGFGNDLPRTYAELASGQILGISTLNNGYIFTIDPQTRVFTRLLSFDTLLCSDPREAFTLTANGHVVGAAKTGGSFNKGALWDYDLSTGVFRIVRSFNSSFGSAIPSGELTFLSSGQYIGTTRSGGTNSVGSIFRYDPSDSSCVDLYSFHTASCHRPDHGLAQMPNGLLVGNTTEGGDYDDGGLFTFNISNSSFEEVDLAFQSSVGGVSVVDSTVIGFTLNSWYTWTPGQNGVLHHPTNYMADGLRHLGGLLNTAPLHVTVPEPSYGPTTLLYPDPAHDVLTIERSTDARCTAHIFDQTGRRVSTVQLERVTTIALHSLAAGTYVIRFDDRPGAQKFIKLD
ncbi:MAG: T9SS type A sorting domain-containing protein [Flavobacteriales bacterium]|nr:T9SS type A sorting domain-containing protein [Flavobacteriales bacterium]